MSSNIGYISLALVGGVVAGVIGAGIYYASGDTNLAPTGMSAYNPVGQQKYYGGKKTRGKKLRHRNTHKRR